MTDIAPILVLVLPCYNEAELLPRSIPRIMQSAHSAAAARGWQLRAILVNDGSSDASATLLDQLASQDARLQVLHFTRNFGKEAALFAGLEHALTLPGAAAVATIDADLQHPPELLQPMLAAHAQGYQIAEAVKQQRGPESLTRRCLAKPFYHLFERASGLPLGGHTDYKLLDIRVVHQLVGMRERGRFYRGLVAWLGHASVRIPFDVPPRPGGRSQWSRLGLVRYAWGNLLTFSTIPLRAVTWLGVLGLAVGAAGGLKSLWDYFSGRASTGFTTVILLQILFGGLILIALGLIGQYLGRIYEEIKARPHYALRASAPSRLPTPHD